MPWTQYEVHMQRALQSIIYTTILILIILTLSSNAQEKRNYHKYTISQVVAENPVNWKHPLTHIEVEGWVTYTKKEGDGDIHIRLCESNLTDAKCLVAEVIPTLTPKGLIPVKKGMHLLVRGIYRYDGENPGHHFCEVHPVEEMEALH